MATKVEKNWLNRMKNNLTHLTDEDRELMNRLDLPGDDVRAALKKEMAKQLNDARYRGLVYRSTVV